jgi:hypothetical protein
MRGEVHKGPPPDIEFPYFEVIFYDQPASAGITVKTTDARSKRWPDTSQSFHSDGSINSWKPSNDDTQHQWRQKIGEFLRDSFILADERLNGMIYAPPSLSSLIEIMSSRISYSPPSANGGPAVLSGRLPLRLQAVQPYEGWPSRPLSYWYVHPLMSIASGFKFPPGSKTVSAFRSPQEFFLHVRWLMMGAEEDSEGYPACECKYCGVNRSQREIDQEFQLPGRKGSHHKNSGYHSGRQGGSSAATSEAIISQAKDYRNLKKPNTE